MVHPLLHTPLAGERVALQGNPLLGAVSLERVALTPPLGAGSLERVALAPLLGAGSLERVALALLGAAGAFGKTMAAHHSSRVPGNL